MVSKLPGWLLLALLLAAPIGAANLLHAPAANQVSPDFIPGAWVYLRDDWPLDKSEYLSSILALGDVTSGRGITSQEDALALVDPRLRLADITLGNLEGVLLSPNFFLRESNSQKSPYSIFGVSTTASWFREAGFDILGLANNHIQDLGNCGISETVLALRRYEIGFGGVASEDNAVARPVFRRVGDLRLAFLFLNAVPLNPKPTGRADLDSGCPVWRSLDWSRKEDWLSAISSTREQVDLLLVSVHWGVEYESEKSFLQQELAHAFVEAGADVVIGHHPHVVQEYEILDKPAGNGKAVILYSLGNFLFDQEFGKTTAGWVGQIFMDHEGLRGIRILPVRTGPQPRFLSSSEVEIHEIIPNIGAKPLAFQCDGLECYQVEVDNPAGSGLFWYGETDLTGDHVPEQVQRQGDKLTIFQAGLPVWLSPDEWEVVDVALGDPDLDGREDVVVAFWKPDSSAVPRSHPFIIGYRGGLYRTLWGGSAVSDPILEIELADVDGDKKPELVVLEELRGKNRQAFSIWRWHGWGFSLVWRSEEGLYENLRTVYSEKEGSSYILISQKSH